MSDINQNAKAESGSTAQNANRDIVNISNNTIQRNEIYSDLAHLINILGYTLKIDIDDTDNPETPPDIMEKLEHNNLRGQYKQVIVDTILSQGIISYIYANLSAEGYSVEPQILKSVKTEYRKTLHNKQQENPNLTVLEIVRNCADTIMYDVQDILIKRVVESSNQNTSFEKIQLCMPIIITDAFMRCKILEKPKQN